jgi:uncharacterized membrane protein
MKKVLLSLLGVILVVGLSAAAGYAGYRFGYAQGVQVTVNGDSVRPGLRPFDNFGPRGMPGHNFGFGRRFDRSFGFGVFPMMGLGIFSLLWFLGRIVVIALVIWFIYWLFTRGGWRLSRETTETSSSKTESE